jgi:hypothetical protein
MAPGLVVMTAERGDSFAVHEEAGRMTALPSFLGTSAAI